MYANTEEEFAEVLAQECDWLAYTGMSTLRMSVADKDRLVRTLVIHHLFNRYNVLNIVRPVISTIQLLKNPIPGELRNATFKMKI